MLVQGRSQETKKEEASRFDEANSQTLKKMQDLQAMIKNSKPNTEADDFDNDDEFDNYMEEHLMQEADTLGIFNDAVQAADANVY